MISAHLGHIKKSEDYRDHRIWIVNMRLFQPPTTTQMISSVVVKQIASFCKSVSG